MKEKVRSFVIRRVALYFILVILISIIGHKCKAQTTFTAYAAAGMTNRYFSADVNAGAIINKLVFTAGYLINKD